MTCHAPPDLGVPLSRVKEAAIVFNKPRAENMSDYTLANVLAEIRSQIVKARSVKVDGLLLDDAEDILDRLVRMDHICLEIQARIDGIDLAALTRMRPAEEFPQSFQRRGGAVSEAAMVRESNGD